MFLQIDGPLIYNKCGITGQWEKNAYFNRVTKIIIR